MSYRTCDHLKEDGVYCDSPALRGHNFCYFHLNVRGRRLKMARALARGEKCRLQLPVPEDMHAVQVSLTQVLDALADDLIDPQRAGLMLYALQQASANLNGTRKWKGSRQTVDHDQPLRALECPNFAQQYELPEGVDLDLPPEVALQNAEQNPSAKPPKKRSRPARVPKPRYHDEDDGIIRCPQDRQAREDVKALDWFFDRLGIRPPDEDNEEEVSAPPPTTGKKPPQSAALDPPPAATNNAQTSTVCVASAGKVG